MDAVFGKVFTTSGTAEAEVHKSAKTAGYNLVIHTKRPSATSYHTVNYRCAKGRSYTAKDSFTHETKRRKTSTQMTSCLFKLIVQKLHREQENSEWVILRATHHKHSEHNHEPHNPAAFSKYRKDAILRKEAQILQSWDAGISPPDIHAQLRSDPDPENLVDHAKDDELQIRVDFDAKDGAALQAPSCSVKAQRYDSRHQAKQTRARIT
ncbi:hypothetical protein G7Z17_g5873 [Cylindrodendrum hubeiense]|uniref:FAR1 domain-containing protein n=1 Tax=Cylindrodendrum hubeiense TaxID=595255 RepID=A0A9P5HBA5_9HYPO|nr:hypothetical protein G7Z17_g5873 [Cylindrodendrum hubeiense]